MTDRRDDIEAEAIGWVIRLRDAGADDWAAFTDWLEADPAHAAAYDEAALAELEWGGLARPERAVPKPRPGARPFNRRFFLGTGIAAALAGIIALGTLQTQGTYAVETAAGERRSVELADGSRVDLNGNSRILLDRGDPRVATLERGEALFTVVHNDADPFEVRTGDVLLRDMGTVFNVLRDGEMLDVAVAEGVVEYNPGRAAVTLRAGMALSRHSDAAPEVAQRSPEAITGWRDGRLIYAATTIGTVAGDLARNLGVPVRAEPDVAQRPFTGVIRVDDGPETIQRAAQLMGVNARPSNGGWTLMAGASETP
ncbi:FecR domain-containing protein [Sphingosinicella sp. YJ22]|uniref:FecR family protein n=1 Tax=Sphingosinicella sp. YJ22 TaxID=1104780 RepID=UPI00140AB1E8|nr:FecR domain-containing protein [Sphingosinicella sp. YJ22]